MQHTFPNTRITIINSLHVTVVLEPCPETAPKRLSTRCFPTVFAVERNSCSCSSTFWRLAWRTGEPGTKIATPTRCSNAATLEVMRKCSRLGWELGSLDFQDPNQESEEEDLGFSGSRARYSQIESYVFFSAVDATHCVWARRTRSEMGAQANSGELLVRYHSGR